MAAKTDNSGYGSLFLLFVIAGICGAIYEGLDSIGWIPHRVETSITAQANWFVGESKNCLSYPMDARMAKIVDKSKGYAIGQVACDDGPQHSVNVTSFGRTEQPEYTWVNWRCTRNAESFTCKQVGNSPAILTGHQASTGKPMISYDSGKTWQDDN